MLSVLFIAVLSYFLAIFVQPTCSATLPVNVASSTQSGPAAVQTICGDIIDLVNDDYYVFKAVAAHRCLTSVPFNEGVALRFIDYYNTTMQFQSTLAYLRAPPAGYQQPAVDLVQELERIRANITNGDYQNQYHFETDLQQVIYAVHDGHVDLYAGVLAAFSFASPYSISSASVDGKKPPQIFFTNDIKRAQTRGWTPSPIISINDEEAVSYLTKFAALNSHGTLEPHADWNQLMGHPARDVQGLYSVFSGAATFYPGDDLVFILENGTKVPTKWAAIYNEPYPTGPLTTGGDFYNYFVLGILPASFNESYPGIMSSNDSVDTGTDGTTANGADGLSSWADGNVTAYPINPAVVQEGLSSTGGGVVTGYFLNDTSTAVLSIPSFDMHDRFVESFSIATFELITLAKEIGMERLVIDLQQNSGGTPFLAFDLFQQLFPTETPYSGSRRRIHPMANVLGNATTGFWGSVEVGSQDYEDYFSSLSGDEWVVTPRINADTGRNFSSWEQYSSPNRFHGDDFSLVERYNTTDPVFEASAFGTWNTKKYTHLQPWAAQNIVVLTDGLCSSTCALFVEMMTQDTHSNGNGVRTITVGGRPVSGPMQAVSGSRGASLYYADSLDVDIQWVQEYLGVEDAALPAPGSRNAAPIRTLWAGFNLRDAVRNDSTADSVPLQFRYQAADCRIYYTLANIYNMSRLWRDVAAAAWDDPSGLCVPDSIGYTTTNSSSAIQKPPPPSLKPVPVNIDIGDERKSVVSTANHTADGITNEILAGRVAKSPTGVVPCTSYHTCDHGREISFPQVSCYGKASRQCVCLPKCNAVSPCGGGLRCTGIHSHPSKKVRGVGPAAGGLLLLEGFERLVTHTSGVCNPISTILSIPTLCTKG